MDRLPLMRLELMVLMRRRFATHGVDHLNKHDFKAMVASHDLLQCRRDLLQVQVIVATCVCSRKEAQLVHCNSLFRTILNRLDVD